MKNIFLFILLSAASHSIAQKYSIKGQIQDPEKNNLVGAVIVALNPSDSVMMGYAVTEPNGAFVLSGLNKGSYDVQFTYIGYGTLQRKVELVDEKIVNLGIIIMNEEGKMLDAVTISAEYIPIKVTKDTLEFNAESFKTQPNALVEDLLKKLPGVEIDADGGIKVQGEDVKAVTVDGKEFFGKDPKMATRNLPADAVKKVQVFDKKSKTAEFTGVDDGLDEKTINLELKEDKKSGFFGNIMAGYGTDNRYESKTMINRFSAKSQISFLGSLNNLNNSGVNVSDFVSMTGGGSQGGGMRNMNFNSGVPISFGQNNTGDTKSITTGLNVNHDFGNKNKLNFSYYLTQSETDLRQNTNTNSFLPTGTLISDKFYTSLSDALNHNFYSVLDLKLDSTTEMTVTGNLGIKGSDGIGNQVDSTFNDTNLLLNLNDQAKTNKTSSDNYSVSLNLRKKFSKKGRNFTMDGSYGKVNSDNTFRILSEVYGRDIILNPDASVFQDQIQNSANNNYSMGASYTEPLSSVLFLTTVVSRKNNNTDLVKDFFDLNPDNTTISMLNEELSRTFDNSFVYNILGTNLRLNKETYSASFGLDFQNSELTGIPNVGAIINPKFNYFLPKASIELDKLNIRVNYSTSVREPSMDQLQPVVDNSDPLNIYKGNPTLVPEYRHNMRLSYNFFDQFNFRSLFANIRLGYTKDRITTSSFVDPELFIRTQTPLNTDAEKTISGNISFSSPLNAIKAKYRLGINSSLINGINFINQQENVINRWSNGINASIENKSKNRFDASIGGRWSYNSNIYKNNENLNSNFLNQTYDGFLALFAGKGWTIDTRMEYNLYGQGSFGEPTSVKLWQASISKGFLSNKLTAKLRVFDILNQNQGVSRSASETNISESISNTIGRYILLNFTYSLSALGPQQNQSPNMHMIMQR